MIDNGSHKMKNISKEDAEKILRRIQGPPREAVSDNEIEHLLTMFHLIEPTSVSNNQRTITYTYIVGGTRYDVTWFPKEDQPMIERFL